jgi:hypothetical protein
MPAPKIMFAMPYHADNRNASAKAVAAADHATRNDLHAEEDHVEVVHAVTCKGSLLPFVFNQLFAEALNKRDEGAVGYFAMLHDDIEPTPGWLNRLWRLMRTRGDVVVSSVVSIKEPERTRTSTAIGDRRDVFRIHRYVNTSDRPGMPATFSTKDVARNENEFLLINTGVWLADLSWPGWNNFQFEFLDRILTNEDSGRRQAFCVSEDWLMSRYLDQHDAPYSATWDFPVKHYGPSDWNSHVLPPVFPTFVPHAPSQ